MMSSTDSLMLVLRKSRWPAILRRQWIRRTSTRLWREIRGRMKVLARAQFIGILRRWSIELARGGFSRGLISCLTPKILKRGKGLSTRRQMSLSPSPRPSEDGRGNRSLSGTWKLVPTRITTSKTSEFSQTWWKCQEENTHLWTLRPRTSICLKDQGLKPLDTSRICLPTSG